MDPERPIPVVPETLTKDNIAGCMLSLAKEFTDDEGAIFVQCVDDFRKDVPFELWPREAQMVWTRAICNGLIYAVALVEFLLPPEETPFTDWALPFGLLVH